MIFNNFLQKSGKNGLEEFIEYYLKIFDIDKNKFLTSVGKCKKYYTSNNTNKSILRNDQTLEKLWYDSLDNNPNYSLYDSDDFIPELWTCWTIYSRRYLQKIQNPKSLNGVSIVNYINDADAVIDLGCGFGYTTAALKEIFIDKTVIGTNIKDTKQYKIAQNIGKECGFEVIDDIQILKNKFRKPLVFASEYFEHINNPIEHLKDINININPGYYLIANAFTAKSFGHFDYYLHNNTKYEAKHINKMFNYELLNGYKKIKTKLWNNRPAFYVKND